MLDSEVVLPVVGHALVERAVLLSGDVLGVTSPEGLGLVELLGGGLDLLDLLRLLVLGRAVLVLLDLLDLGLLGVLLVSLLVLDLLRTNGKHAIANQYNRKNGVPSRPP